MESFGLLVGHLLGDYIFQNDWLAKNKTNPVTWHKPGLSYLDDSQLFVGDSGGNIRKETTESSIWREKIMASQTGHVACTVHCLLYTAAVWACAFWWMPWWGVVACFVLHWPVDRFGLAKWWMMKVSGQEAFATGALAPWSIIVVDNTFHLLVLFLIGLIARGVES
jgi:hypothetical protein